MGFLITILAISTITSAAMLLLLMQITRLKSCTTAWSYFLLRTGIVFMTLPLFLWVCACFAYLARPIEIPVDPVTQPDFISMYEGSYWILDGSPSQKPYMRLIVAIWLLGVFIKAAAAVMQIARFYFTVLARSTPVTEPELLEMVQAITDELQIKANIPVYRNDSVHVPMLVILKKPAILICEDNFSRQELFYILKHELIHLKRKHILFKRLGFAAQILYWFNPFFHYFLRFFSDYCELDCDREALKNETNPQRLFYAHLLLRLMEKDTPHNPAIESAFLGRKNQKILERRFHNIMYKPKNKTGFGVVALSVCYLLCCPVLTFGATKAGAEIATDFVIMTKGNDLENNQISDTYPLDADTDYPVESVLVMDRRGTNPIEQYISAGKSASVSLTADSSSMRIVLFSDSTSDTFHISFNGYGANSSNGIIAASFDAAPNKTYQLRINNDSDHTIHITGYATS